MTVSKGGKREDRDEQGRFRPGHRQPGPGNPAVRKIAKYRKALERAISAEDLEAVLRALLKEAKVGDAVAARLLLDRALGRPRVEPDEAVALDLPPLEDAGSIVEAAGVVLEALAAGELTGEQAGRIAGVLEVGRKTIETQELAAKIEQLEDLVKRLKEKA